MLVQLGIMGQLPMDEAIGSLFGMTSIQIPLAI